MAAAVEAHHDAGMNTDSAPLDQEHALSASAHQLQRAAGALQRHAASAHAVPTLGITVAHVEEALDRLAVAMEQIANAVTDWCSEGSSIADEDALPPEARALRWHLQAVADGLRASEDACSVSRDWVRRLLGDAPDMADEADKAATAEVAVVPRAAS